MAKRGQRNCTIFSQWYWIWLVSAFFVGVMVVFFFIDYPGWFHFAYRGVSLSHEMSYAVWWSGICLFLAGIVFARVGAIAQETGTKPWVWYVLSLAMIALCFDEVGSLHETVARVGGWWGLLPFALVFAVAFSLTLFQLLRHKPTRQAAVLIVIGISIFVAVAGLEALEHDLGFQHNFWRRVRLVGEEAIELVAMGILITSGLIAMKRLGDGDRRFLNATVVVENILDYPMIIFALFITQIAFTAVVIVPNYTFFPEGNPSALFPILLFFCLGIIARLRAQQIKERHFWNFIGLSFFIASLSQMYNLNTFLNHIMDIEVGVMTGPPLSWVVTTIPLALLCIHEIRTGRLPLKRAAIFAALLFFIYLLVYPDLEFRYRIEYLYFLFSSAVAYSCYQVIRLKNKHDA